MALDDTIGDPHEPSERLRRMDDYERGVRAQQIASIREDVSDIKSELKEHREEEKRTWENFNAALDRQRVQIEELTRWRIKVVTLAGAVSAAITFLWHLFTRGKI